jgi:hypothetical protein
MLPDANYARQLDNELDSIGNDQDAINALGDALDRFIPTEEDWEDYEQYLDRLDMIREYPPETSPLWKSWLNRIH